MSSFTDDQLRILEKSVIECRDVNILLGDFVSEELPQCLTQRLNEHILECDSCKESVENYKVVIILAGKLGEESDIELPKDVAKRLRMKLNQTLGISLPISEE